MNLENLKGHTIIDFKLNADDNIYLETNKGKYNLRTTHFPDGTVDEVEIREIR